MNGLQLGLYALLSLLLPRSYDVDVPQPHELAPFTLRRLDVARSQSIISDRYLTVQPTGQHELVLVDETYIRASVAVRIYVFRESRRMTTGRHDADVHATFGCTNS